MTSLLSITAALLVSRMTQICIILGVAIALHGWKFAAAENVPDLSQYGYDYSWSNAKIGYLRRFDLDSDFTGTVYDNVSSAEDCAQKCVDDGKPGGAWISLSADLGGGQCLCQNTIQCVESCIVFTGFSFANEDLSDIPCCEKTYCEDYYDENNCEPGGASCLCGILGGSEETPDTSGASLHASILSSTSILVFSVVCLI